ncbi:ESS family glutamate:Na+ symporter [Angulomicrobium tetraedrale]|uniref:Sodium/glutamate symporter n=1 Tax=Ancylobacter tetraedralis TaxID=217068 RepID=A0A839Z6K2_9HYPH|nr:sodium/glutamate symporter [Ancylobacter tetraedralis]MBB3770210.1 ESS family glutamate:Na+ symporter [Ancylobacter tetraedralis]
MTTLETPGFLTFTIAIVVFFAGVAINRAIPPLKAWNIPEAVTGGLLMALATFLAYRFLDVEIRFALEARDMLLLYFFTGIGLNAKLDDLITGGRPLLVLLILTVVFLVLQNLIAAGSVAALGLPEGLTVFLGSASLIGGHGTTIAWAPLITERFNIPNAMEVGIATATLGLVVASLVGGPIARHLIARHGLHGPKTGVDVIGLPDKSEHGVRDDVSHVSLLRTVLVLNVAILIGFFVDELLDEVALKLPLFVICLLVAIVMTNTVPRLLPNLVWPTRTRALALVSDFSFNVFLSMSLMSMQLWTLGGLGPALMLVLGLQTLAAVLYIVFIVFPAMGRNYEAAVLSAGFTGISLGATPTAIANMTAVTKTHGAAPRAFIILPLVSAFFIDIVNAAVIGYLAS